VKKQINEDNAKLIIEGFRCFSSNLSHSERKGGTFRRSFHFPMNVKKEACSETMDNGVFIIKCEKYT